MRTLYNINMLRIINERNVACMRVYLDNCSFNRPFDNQNAVKIKIETQAKLYVQHLVLEKA